MPQGSIDLGGLLLKSLDILTWCIPTPLLHKFVCFPKKRLEVFKFWRKKLPVSKKMCCYFRGNCFCNAFLHGPSDSSTLGPCHFTSPSHLFNCPYFKWNRVLKKKYNENNAWIKVGLDLVPRLWSWLFSRPDRFQYTALDSRYKQRPLVINLRHLAYDQFRLRVSRDS